mmetsp:Transcript_25659/g.38849  ORF Transcript_25659/g.38849 Transcript_25659/m.38849 type:complete len:311 (-) Transcript_25659:92-1024(-)|eukprot:CAMPEP_0178914804 /NCGR_PEP_ID=MMETSP0786-20121207/11644_1 /TAXON_ID=186022 /ORGANISM="Thalassionema frauenfeldii, Strain CCMP 1798" /LENGTH=310 /DNA_ID=CAMNT_0020587783 /DNA_START=105 /DNA_END=1037 /DNA_ORIENTATION=+
MYFFFRKTALIAMLPFLPACAGIWRQKGVKVTVYDGPKPSECKASDDSQPTKILPDYTVSFHFTITIDETSKTGKPRSRVTSSKSDRGGNPAALAVGQNKMIKGLDEGMVGLCKGSKAYIVIPPHLAYGEDGAPKIPGGATIRYDVEILDILPPLPNDFAKMDTNSDWELTRDEVSAYFSKIGQKIDVNGLWKKEDADGDGIISWQEFSGPKGRDGPPKERDGVPLPKNPDFELSDEQREAEEEIKSNLNVFYHMDEDKDGKVSKEEMAKALASFGETLEEELWLRSDTDGDGYIAVDEFALMGTDHDEL